MAGSREEIARLQEVAMATVEIREVRKSFGSTGMLHGIDIAVEEESFTVPVGPRAAASRPSCP